MDEYLLYFSLSKLSSVSTGFAKGYILIHTLITISKNKTQKLVERRLWAEWSVVPHRKTDTYTNTAQV